MIDQRTFLTKAKYYSLNKQLEFMLGEGTIMLSKLLASSPSSGMGRPLDLPIHDLARRFYSEIDAIKEKLKYAEIIEKYVEGLESKERVDIGAKVEIEDIPSGTVDTYFILGSDEVDPDKGKISFKSPLGKAMIGKKSGDIINLENTGYRGRIKLVMYEELNFKYIPYDWKSTLMNF